ARLLKQYPSITSMQTIKALIINSAEKIVLGPEFREFSKRKRHAITGRGKPNDTDAIFSDAHRVTFIIEGSVDPGMMEIYELALPAYLNEMYKSQGLLKVNSTLCFKFNPVPDNHISYCPIHFAFGFFKNIPASQITESNLDEVKLKQGWTEDYYFGVKMLSNTQKVSFSISKSDIISEDNKVKIGIHSHLHKLLSIAQKGFYNQPHSYSLVISIEENTLPDKREHSLYDELTAINELDAIAEIELDAEV
ncbi:MAG TPA: hypothetical protein VE912_23910, partial [Bacteroidales bacterium]|nr:hypothetical protein [Bacteroidales bacterium]